jgi:alpha-tubulin suppressor-like RCC1 family protein
MGALTLAVAAPASATSNGATAWGENELGELGNGITEGSSLAVAVSNLSGVTAVSAGSQHSLALLSNGTVMAWGRNEDAELGDGTIGGYSDVPVAVSGLSGVTAISAGKRFSLALLSNGTVMAWGDNKGGELGDGTTGGNSDVPVAVSGLSGVTAVSAGGEDNHIEGDAHGLALLSNGTVMAWGHGGNGELGNGKTTSSDVPVAVHGLSGVAAVSAGDAFSLAALKNGTAMAWGFNESGQLGDGTTTGSNLPVAVSALSGVTAVSAGSGHSLALLNDGTVMAWGSNSEGQLGNGGFCIELPRQNCLSDVPGTVSGLGEVTAIAAGGGPGGEGLSLALLSNGTVTAWGDNLKGQLGILGHPFREDVPTTVTGLRDVMGISAGGQFSSAFGPPLPAVFEVTPNQGPEAGGISVTITGVHLGGATAVDFGSTSASFTVNSDSSITAVSPPGVGTVDVTVTTPEGTTPTSSTDRFSYGVPTVTKVVPRIGPIAGGTAVTITGTNFTRATAVSFGSNNASSFTITSPTKIAVVAPPAATVGFVYVTVTTPGGTNAVSKSDVFTYAPTVTAISPNSGSTAGGTSVTVTGTGFVVGATAFKFGKAKKQAASCSSTTTCTIVSPAHEAGIVDVKAVVTYFLPCCGVKTVASPKNSPADQFTYQ